MDRRKFVNYSAKLAGLGAVGFSPLAIQNQVKEFSKIRIKNVDL